MRMFLLGALKFWSDVFELHLKQGASENYSEYFELGVGAVGQGLKFTHLFLDFLPGRDLKQGASKQNYRIGSGRRYWEPVGK